MYIDIRDSYKLHNIREVDIEVKNWQWIRLKGDLYIQKYGSYYVIFQKSSSLNYSIEYLEDINKGIKSSGGTITFINTFKDSDTKIFYSDNIKFDFIIDSKYDSKCYSKYYITAIFIPIAYTDIDLSVDSDLQKYVSNLYMLYSDVTNYDSTTTYYASIPRYAIDSIASGIEKVIFNDPATIVFWNDGTKTVVKTQNNEKYDKEKGLSMAIAKKMLGNNSKYYDTFKKWIK